MGFFNDVGKFMEDPFGIASTVYHAATGAPTAAEKRSQAALAQAQIDAYKKQTQIADDAISAARDQEAVEKRRINEKQIRSLRRNYRPAGFLDSNDATGDQLQNTLGA